MPLVTECQEKPATAVRWNLHEEMVSEGTAGPLAGKAEVCGKQREQYGGRP